MRITRFLNASTTILGPNRVEAIAGTSQKARDGHIVEMRGMDTSAFLRSGTVLWGHNPDAVVGTPVAGRVDASGNLLLTIDFAPEGVSDRADETRRLVKAGVVRNLSIGFDVIDATPLDPKKPRAGLRVTRSELLEVSFVAVPANSGAVVTARAARAGKVLSGENAGALRDAHDLAERCRSTIADVLDGAGEERDADFERRQRQCEALALRQTHHEQEIEIASPAFRQQQVKALKGELARLNDRFDFASRQRSLAIINELAAIR